MMSQVNLIAVIVASIIVYLFGWFLYSPKGFGKVWMQGVGYRKQEIDMQWYHFLGGFLTVLVAAWVFAGLIQTFALNALGEGVEFGFSIALGFAAVALFNDLFMKRQNLLHRPFKQVVS